MRSLRLVALLAIPAQIAFGQQTPASRGGTLTLEDAIAIAQRNNPALPADPEQRSECGRAGADAPTARCCRRRARSFAPAISRVERSTSRASRFPAAVRTTTVGGYSLGLELQHHRGGSPMRPRAAKANRERGRGRRHQLRRECFARS